MKALLEQLDTYKQEIADQQATDPQQLEAFRIKYLGTKGLVKSVFGGMKDVPADQRREFGQKLNEFKQFVEEKYEALKSGISQTETKAQEEDLTRPGNPVATGTRHPISLVTNRIINIFQRLGFSVADGPEIEDDWHNFTALNLPENHPARDMQDTFYVDGGSGTKTEWLLRTHTSNVQIREMEKGQLPIRIICPGRVYRNETISARSHCFFHQVEGLYIDENVSFADLKQTLYFFVQEMFGHRMASGETLQVRFRPSYFPFTEPSAEMDVSCFICSGSGCRICKHTGWVEILGCGMVHPKVLENCGIDPDKYTGFAFGMGVERPAMLLYDVNDIRLFSENDIRFLNQFKGAI